MAHQHFYSRVPARISMYNKFDSFDTFAHSRELARDFIERELSLVYADKLSKNDMVLVRKGEIKPVYYQCNLKSGKFVQGCITYLPLDYTGERSAYFTHSLILTDEEKKQVLEDNMNSIFNKDLFKNDISEFDITSPNATPNKEYPELEYKSKPLSEVQGLYKKYDPETIKSFIGSILLSLCKKGKNIYFKLDVNDDELSAYAVKFINEIMSILPSSFKQNLSFITYLNDYTQYPSFKLKCVSSKCPEIYQEKGVFFDFKINLVTGLDLEEIRNNKTIINFLYSLLENNEMRKEFLDFVTSAITNIPSLQILNLKTLSDLIFLFCGTSGFFTETNVIPNDESVLEFFTTYEKYRVVLNDEYRMRAYNVLKRYPKNHLGIPKLVFSKISKLYPTDIQQAKTTAINIVLELIHTDAMREKLFTFIANNYEKEDEDTKKLINNDLCRVFYGGFLQTQILKHFTSIFAGEPVETQNQILEKLLLTIRTTSIQPKILEFIDLHYNNFTEEQKQSLYTTIFEMLSECDALASALVTLTNKHGKNESDNLIIFIEKGIEKTLESDYRKRENLLLPILFQEEGLCADIPIKLIFTAWHQRKAYNQFIEILKQKDALLKTNLIIQVLTIVSDMDIVVEEKFKESVKGIYLNNYDNTSLYDWLDIYQKLNNTVSSNQSNILKYIRNEEVNNGIINSLNDVFDVKKNIEGIDILQEFVKTNRTVRESNNYQFISKCIDMIGNIKIDEFSKAINIYDTLPVDYKLRYNIGNHISTCVIDRKKQTHIETMYFDILVNHLKDNKISLDKIYNNYKDIYKRQYHATHGAKANPKNAIEEASGNAMKLLFDCCYTMCKTSAQLNEAICHNDSKLKTCVQDFVTNYGNKTKKWVNGVLSHVESNQFTNYFNKMLKECKPQSGGLFKIFKK